MPLSYLPPTFTRSNSEQAITTYSVSGGVLSTDPTFLVPQPSLWRPANDTGQTLGATWCLTAVSASSGSASGQCQAYIYGALSEQIFFTFALNTFAPAFCWSGAMACLFDEPIIFAYPYSTGMEDGTVVQCNLTFVRYPLVSTEV